MIVEFYTTRPKIEHPKFLFSEILAGMQGPVPFRARIRCGRFSIPPLGTPGFSPGGLHFCENISYCFATNEVNAAFKIFLRSDKHESACVSYHSLLQR